MEVVSVVAHKWFQFISDSKVLFSKQFHVCANFRGHPAIFAPQNLFFQSYLNLGKLHSVPKRSHLRLLE